MKNILDQLLGDRAPALNDPAGLQVFYEGPGNTGQVYAFMVVKILILGPLTFISFFYSSFWA